MNNLFLIIFCQTQDINFTFLNSGYFLITIGNILELFLGVQLLPKYSLIFTSISFNLKQKKNSI